MKRKIEKQVKKQFKTVFLAMIVLLIAFIFSEVEKRLDDLNDKNVTSVQNVVEYNELSGDDLGFNVYYFDVGQADAILLENNNNYMMIDAGNNADGSLLVDYMKSIGVKRLDYLIATHAHEDHIGGMDDIINNFEIDKFYMPDVVTTTKTFEDVIVALETNEVALNIPEIDDTFTLGNVRFQFVYFNNNENDLNENSIVLRGVHGNNSFLFMGDATEQSEREILNNRSVVRSDLLKAGHHGSRYSSSKDFLERVLPKYVIVSTGLDNSYGHPHDEALLRFKDIGAKVYRTDEEGTILVSSDGNNITIKNLDTDVNGR